MKRSIATALAFSGAVGIAGCSSTKNTTARVSFVEPGPAPATHYTDATYNDTTPAFDRDYVATETSTTITTPPSQTPRASLRPVSMPVATGRHDMTLDEFRGHVRSQSAIIVDAREPKHFKQGHVRGAINIPSGDEDAYMSKFRKEVAPDSLVIVYCGGPDCPAGENVAAYLNTQGYTNLRVYTPGWQHLSKTDLHE